MVPTEFATRALSIEITLAVLLLLYQSCPYHLDDSDLISLLTFTNVDDPWTTPQAAAMARELIAIRLSSNRASEFIAGSLLRYHLRPLFSRPPGMIAHAGRTTQSSESRPNIAMPSETPLWKQQEPSVIPAFQWAVEVADVGFPNYLTVAGDHLEMWLALTKSSTRRLLWPKIGPYSCPSC